MYKERERETKTPRGRCNSEKDSDSARDETPEVLESFFCKVVKTKRERERQEKKGETITDY